jgi:toxin YoeB
MSRAVSFTSEGWEDYLYWQAHNKQTLKKINQLVKECQRDPFLGTGKPEPLRNELSGTWSRRITGEHRLIYLVMDDEIRIFGCHYHYK